MLRVCLLSVTHILLATTKTHWPLLTARTFAHSGFGAAFRASLGFGFSRIGPHLHACDKKQNRIDVCASSPPSKGSTGEEMPFYAVKYGKRTGIYLDWAGCSEQVTGFKGAVFKKFNTMAEAEIFCNGGVPPEPTKSPVAKPLKRKASDLDDATEADPPSKKHAAETPGSSTAQQVDSTVTIVYTDGACPNNGKLTARAGVGVYWAPYDPYNLSERLEGKQTNQRAEVTAGIRALELAKKRGVTGKLEVRTDSKYLINAVTSWMHKWKKSDWTIKVENKDLFVRLDELVGYKGAHNVIWTYVAGHSGDPGNDAADALAVAGAHKEIKQ